jgi:hypothetical protein
MLCSKKAGPGGSSARRFTAVVIVVGAMLSAPVTVTRGAAPTGFGGGSGDRTISTSADRRSEAADTRRPVLIDRLRQAGLVRHHMTWSSSEVDYNRDGRPDLWIGKHQDGGDLWRNTGRGKYVRVRSRAWPHRNPSGLVVDRHDCQWADVDRNGRPDAYCSAGRFGATIVKSGNDNELWLQRPAGRFRDVGTAWGVGDRCGRGRNVVFLNFNHDRFPDLFVGNQVPPHGGDVCTHHPRRYPNQASKLFINVRGDRFRYAKAKFRFGPGPGSRCALNIDFDQDHWDDLVACDTVPARLGKYRSGTNQPAALRLFRNKHGRRFADRSDLLPNVRVNDATVADIDHDHDPDLVLARYRNFLYSLNTDGQFGTPVRIGTAPVGTARAVAVGDADNDGDLDVFGMIGHLGHHNPNDRLFLNDGLAFTTVVAPRARGTADEVIAVHPRVQAPAQFLVMNGWHFNKNTNVQLLTLRR